MSHDLTGNTAVYGLTMLPVGFSTGDWTAGNGYATKYDQPQVISSSDTVGSPLLVTHGVRNEGFVGNQSLASGVQSGGCPYFSAASNPATTPSIGGSETGMTLTFTMHTLPMAVQNPNESDPLFSYHEADIGGVELMYLGVAPNGALIGKTKNHSEARSAPGLVTADGLSHTARMSAFTDHLDLYFDDLLVASMFDSGNGLIFPTNTARFMLFNGRNGRTRCSCTIAFAQIAPEGRSAISWDLTQTDDLTIPWNEDPDWAGFNMEMTLAFYDPRPDSPLWWGPVPPDIRRCMNSNQPPIYTAVELDENPAYKELEFLPPETYEPHVPQGHPYTPANPGGVVYTPRR